MMLAIAISPCVALLPGPSGPSITGTAPSLAALTDGDTLSSAVTWGSATAPDGETLTGASPLREMNIGGAGWVAYNGATVVDHPDTVQIRETWAVVGDTLPARTFASGQVAVAAVAPSLTASDSLSERTLTITVDSVTGTDPITTALTTLTLDGADVLGDETGTGPWEYVIPDSASSQTVAWTLTATGPQDSDTASGSEAVAANILAPTISISPTSDTIPAGTTGTIATITLGGTIGTMALSGPDAAAFDLSGSNLNLAAAAVQGTYSVTVTHTNPAGSASATFDLTVNAAASIAANSDGTVDITLSDGGSFSVTISGSAITHQNGTWGPFDPADLDNGPINVVPPEVTGTVGLGDTLTAAPGVWVWDTANGTASVTANWQRDGSNITGETGATYTIAEADESAAITYLETADDDVAGTVTQASNTINVGAFDDSGEILTEAGAAMLAEDGQVMLTEAFTGNEMLAENGDDMLTEDDRLILTEAA